MWNQQKKSLSEFLAEHHDLVLYDPLHHVKAFLLFLPKCSCDNSYQCSKWRRKITLVFNTNIYNKAAWVQGWSVAC